MWFDSWSTVVRILAVGLASYAALVVFLRVSGKRVLAKLNAFDFVVTVALGSVLASAVVSKEIRYADALTGMIVLIGGQIVVSRVTTWLPGGRRFVNAEPTLVVRNGELLHDAVHGMRLTESEVHQAIRSSGQGAVGSVAAVVLEPDGTLSVIGGSALGDGRALWDVRGWD